MSRLFTIRARDADDLSKALPSGMALEDVETFSEIYKNIATCGRNIDPEGLEFREGVKLCSYFCRMGSMRFFITRDEDTRGSILDRLFTDFVLNANFDEESRIKRLVIQINQSDHIMLDAPIAIGRLDRLRRLIVNNCKSLPYLELSKLPRLEYLRLQQCSGSLTRSLSEIRLSHLTELHLRDFDLPSSAILFAWINQLPSLKFLVCDKMDCTPDAFFFWILHLETSRAVTWYPSKFRIAPSPKTI